MVNVAEAVHGVYTAHMVHGTASLPTVPLGTVNDDEEAYPLAEAAKEEAELNK